MSDVLLLTIHNDCICHETPFSSVFCAQAEHDSWSVAFTSVRYSVNYSILYVLPYFTLARLPSVSVWRSLSAPQTF